MIYLYYAWWDDAGFSNTWYLLSMTCADKCLCWPSKVIKISIIKRYCETNIVHKQENIEHFGGVVASWLATCMSARLIIRVVYNSPQPAKFTSFSAMFRRLLSLLHKSRYVEEMMFIRSHNHLLFTKLQLLKILIKTLHYWGIWVQAQ